MSQEKKQFDFGFALSVLKTLAVVLFAFVSVPAAIVGAYALVFFSVALVGDYGHGDLSVPFYSAATVAAVTGAAVSYGVFRLFRQNERPELQGPASAKPGKK